MKIRFGKGYDILLLAKLLVLIFIILIMLLNLKTKNFGIQTKNTPICYFFVGLKETINS